MGQMCNTWSYVLVFSLLLISASESRLADGRCTYCVSNPKASIELIQSKLDYACGQIPESCDLVQPGGPCYVPNNVRATASYVFNDWYTGGSECDFDGAEVVTTTDPSHGNCNFKCAPWRLRKN